MTFDLVSFVNLVISSLIGVASGLLITHWYWQRSAPVERILKELKLVLPYYLHPIRQPQFYSPSATKVAPDQEAPADTDVPHIEYAVLSNNIITAGSEFEVLLSIRDTGRNFENPSGLLIRDHVGREVAASFSGLGFASAAIVATPNPTQQVTTITVRLRDTVGKENEQSISFHITP